MESNGWQVQWLARYGPTQKSHYHSAAHEGMVVLSGSARIRFGVADLPPISAEGEEERHEDGGIEIDAQIGDVFIIPAGVAHKTIAAQPVRESKRLSPGTGHGEDGGAMRAFLRDVELDGFTMMGAYPRDGSTWDFATGGESEGAYQKVWTIAKPSRDPALGQADEGLRGQWKCD